MYLKFKVILFLFLSVMPYVQAVEPNTDNHSCEQSEQAPRESLVKAFGKGILGYSLGLCTTAAVFTLFASVRKDLKDHTDLYIATAFISAFTGGCAANCVSNRYPKETLLGVSGLSLITLLLTLAAYTSK